MIFPDPKKAATMILSKFDKDGNGKDMEVKSEAPIGDMDEGLKSAAEDIMMAINDKSPMDLMKALKSFCDMADDDSEEGEE